MYKNANCVNISLQNSQVLPDEKRSSFDHSQLIDLRIDCILFFHTMSLR